MTRLVQQESTLGTFETFHFAGHWDADGTRMTQAIQAASGNPNIPVRRFPWPAVTLLSPFVTLFHEMREMRYLWREPLRLKNDRLLSALTTEPQTPLEQAVRMTLSGLGCLKRVQGGSS
jgi:nucleoside-diphosphate-sugar epimerase